MALLLQIPVQQDAAQNTGTVELERITAEQTASQTVIMRPRQNAVQQSRALRDAAPNLESVDTVLTIAVKKTASLIANVHLNVTLGTGDWSTRVLPPAH
ncbi:hypothetical protein CBS147346_9492 [Aspergillus niger]|nr:hypothetical protein CBS147346_9492 [Aspergillus niger]